MKLPQVVVYESDGMLAGQVRRLAEDNAWLVRESRQPDACLNLLSEVRPSGLLLKIERELLDGLTLLSRVSEPAPDCPVLLVSDVKMEGAEERAQLEALGTALSAVQVPLRP